jgi:hypothetical protein
LRGYEALQEPEGDFGARMRRALQIAIVGLLISAAAGMDLGVMRNEKFFPPSF